MTEIAEQYLYKRPHPLTGELSFSGTHNLRCNISGANKTAVANALVKSGLSAPIFDRDDNFDVFFHYGENSKLFEALLQMLIDLHVKVSKK